MTKPYTIPIRGKHEELVGEIYDALSRFAGHVIRYQASGDQHAEHECKMAHAHTFIAATLSAVRDGLPLPDEVGRWIPGDESGGKFSWRILKEIGYAPILIALDPEGTGKEELLKKITRGQRP